MDRLLTRKTATVSDLGQNERRTLLQVCQALLDADALRIIGALALADRTQAELAQQLGASEAQLAQQLGRLRWLELISLREAPNARGQWHLEEKTLGRMTRELGKLSKDVFSERRAPSVVDDAEGDEAERRILQNFFRDDHLVNFPAQEKKKLVVLKWFAGRFQLGERYSEKQINTELLRYHRDSATLRRALIDYRFMARENGVYWRLPDEARDRPVANQAD